VWYVANDPKGPWKVADNRPDDIDDIPPSNPHFNTKYVYVYDSTPEVVYVGYTPAYFGSYPYYGCVVYGTGWYYPPWFGSYYYPYHSTWGFHVRYNSYYGWGVGVSWSSGPFTISFGGGGYGGYYPYGGLWGPGGFVYAPSYHYHDWDGARPGWEHPRDRLGEAGRTRPGEPGSGLKNLYNNPENRERIADLRSNRTQPGAARERANDVFAGRDGSVYRKAQEGGWQKRQGGGWKDSRASGGLDRDHRARQRGGQRAGSFQGRRGGGGLRRR
jgi:hypothetical protein